MDLVSTMEHPETYEPQAPAPFRQVDGLYDWLKDGQFRYVFMYQGFHIFMHNRHGELRESAMAAHTT